MNIEELIRTAVRAELQAFEGRVERLLGEGRAQDLTTVTRAAKLCGIDADTVRRHYLPRIKKYGTGRKLRISPEDLRRAMAEERSEGVDVDALAERITKRGRQ